MLRVYCLQQWYNLSDPGAEEALYDIQSMRAFVGLELGRDAIHDETTILNFRHLLEHHELTKAIFAAVAEHLAAKGELLRGHTHHSQFAGQTLNCVFKLPKKTLIERALGAELTEHRGYEKGDPSGRGGGNSRNGTSSKTILTEDHAHRQCSSRMTRVQAQGWKPERLDT